MCWLPLLMCIIAFGLLPSRLVIFGDEWSGILPPGSLHKRSKAAPSHVWTELLCSHIHADCDSFAPSHNVEVSSVEKGVHGAAVDNIIFNQNSTVPDLRTQVAAWIESEQKSRAEGKAQERSSMFTMFFGVNDVWEYSGYSRTDGIAAVDASLDSMFEQLGVVDNYWPDPIQVLVPYVLDVYVILPLHLPFLDLPVDLGLTVAVAVGPCSRAGGGLGRIKISGKSS